MPLRRRTVAVLFAVLLVFALLFTLADEDLLSQKAASTPEVFVGVSVAYGNETAVYAVADAVYVYANLIIVGSLNVTQDTAALTRVCNFLYQKGFYFIVYVGFSKTDFLPPRGPDSGFLSTASVRWGDKFLGVYLFDEAGGRQLGSTDKIIPSVPNSTFDAKDYTYASEAFVETLTGALTINVDWFNPSLVQSQLFTSDYALYWYDYLSGYGTVFSEFVGNQSRQIAVALDRGAAHVLGKDWGVMITYQDNGPENATQLYSDMTFAWQSGAKYIVVFDGNSTDASSNGVLTQAHIDAMKQFWNYTKTNTRSDEYPADMAYVLPADYGFGLRSSSDTIWGLWNADALSTKVWNDANSLLATYGNNLDIIYETRIDHQPIALPYKTLIFWNSTTIQSSLGP
jgi:hypothetical protein